MPSKTSLPDPNALVEDLPDPATLVETPTGLPSINESTGPTPDPSAFVNPSGAVTANASPAKPSFDPTGAASVAIDKLNPGVAGGGAMLGAIAAAPLTEGASLIPALMTTGAAGAVGAAGAEAWHQVGQHFSNFMAKLPFGSNGAPSTPTEAGNKITEAGEVGAVQGAAGEVLSRGVGLVTNRFKDRILDPVTNKFLSPSSMTIEEALAAQKEFGIPQTPAQTTNSPVLKWFENKLRNNPKTAGPMNEFDIHQLQAKIAARDKLLEDGNATGRLEDMGLSIQADINRLIQKTGLSLHPDVQAIKQSVLSSLGSKESELQLGLDAQTAVKSFLDAKQAAKDGAYDILAAEMPPDFSATPKNFVQALQDAKEELMQGSPALRKEAGTQKQINVIDRLLETHNKYPPEIQGQIDEIMATVGPNIPPEQRAALEQRIVEQLGVTPSPMMRNYAQMNEDAKLLGAAATDEYGKQGSRVSVVYQKIRQALRQDMKDLAQNSGDPTLFDKQIAADALNADWKNAQANKNIKAIIEAKPTAVSEIVVNPGNDQMILDMQKNFPELYPRIQQKATNALFDSGGKPLTGDIVRENLAKFGETANTVWDKKTQENILNAADTIDGRIDFGKAIANNPVFKSAVEANPTMVADKFIQKERVGPIVLARKYLPAETNDMIDRAFLRKTLVSDGNGGFDSVQSLNTFNEYGKEVYSALYGPDKAAQLERFLRLAAKENSEQLINKVPARGQMSNSLLGFGAILYGMIRHPAVTAAGLASSWGLAPLISKQYLTPFVADWMTKGIETPATIKAAIPVVNMVAGQMSAALASYIAQNDSDSEN